MLIPVKPIMDGMFGRHPLTYDTAKLEEDPILTLKDTLQDSLFNSLQTQSESYQGMFPGREYYANSYMDDRRGIFEDILVHGPCYFAWVCNRSGSTLAQGALVKWQQTTITNIDSGAVGSITKAAEFTADELRGDLLICTDDAGGAGAAPEGEGRVITRNTANTCYVQPDFSAAPAANDDFVIRSQSKVVASAIGDNRAEVAGVVLRSDGIADNYWGWILTMGRCAVLGKATTAIAADVMLIADTGRVTVSSTSADGVGVGYSLSALAADSSSDLFWAYMDCRTVLAVTA